MTDTFSATLWLAPHAMKRPRKAPDGHMYSPSAGTVTMFQSELRANGFHQWAARHQDKYEPIEVRMRFGLERPKRSPYEWPVAKRHGDIDNLEKTVLDAINGFVGDERVVSVTTKKAFNDAGEPASVMVWVTSADDE